METFRFQFNLVATNLVIMVVKEPVTEFSNWSEKEMGSLAMVQLQRAKNVLKGAVVPTLIATRQRDAWKTPLYATKSTTVDRMRMNQSAPHETCVSDWMLWCSTLFFGKLWTIFLYMCFYVL